MISGASSSRETLSSIATAAVSPGDDDFPDWSGLSDGIDEEHAERRIAKTAMGPVR